MVGRFDVPPPGFRVLPCRLVSRNGEARGRILGRRTAGPDAGFGARGAGVWCAVSGFVGGVPVDNSGRNIKRKKDKKGGGEKWMLTNCFLMNFLDDLRPEPTTSCG